MLYRTGMEFPSHLTFLEGLCAQRGITLDEVCRGVIAQSTLQRWRRGEKSPQERTAKKLFDKIMAIPPRRPSATTRRGGQGREAAPPAEPPKDEAA